MINYTPFGHSDWQNIVASIKKFGSAGKKTAVVSTINGDANVPFYKELGNQGIKATDIPVVAFSVGEEELAGLDTKPLVGHLAAWNYFQSVDNPDNKAFIEAWQKFTKNPKRTTNDPMEAHVIGFNMWVKGVEKAATDRTRRGDRRADRRVGAEPVGRLLGDDAEPPHHQAGADRRGPGRRPVQHVWQTPGLVVAQEWSPYVEDTKDLIGDWRAPLSCGAFNVKTGKCWRQVAARRPDGLSRPSPWGWPVSSRATPQPLLLKACR